MVAADMLVMVLIHSVMVWVVVIVMVMGMVDVSGDLVGNTYNHIHSKPGTKTYNTQNIQK